MLPGTGSRPPTHNPLLIWACLTQIHEVLTMVISQTEAHLRRIELQGTLNTGSHARQDDPGAALEALGAPVDEWDNGRRIQHAFLESQK